VLTVPALESLLDALVGAGERVSIELRDTRVLPMAHDQLLPRWHVEPGAAAGTHRLVLPRDGRAPLAVLKPRS
jgi:hypothetical protein